MADNTNIKNLVFLLKQAVNNPSTSQLDEQIEAALDAVLSKEIKQEATDGNPIDRAAIASMVGLEVGAPAETCTTSRALANQRFYFVRFTPKRAITVNGAAFFSDTTVAGASPTTVRYGLFTITEDGNYMYPFARTVNDTTLFSVAMTKYSLSFSDGWARNVTLVPGRTYAIGIIIDSAAALPAICACPSVRTILQGEVRAAQTGALTDLPWAYNAGMAVGIQVPFVTLNIGGNSNIAKTCVLYGDSFFASFSGWFGLANAQAGAKLHPLKNAGVGGQTLAQIYARWATDVLPYTPEYVVLCGGANDLFAEFVTDGVVISRYKQIIAAAQVAGIKLIICTPSSNTVASAQQKTYLAAVRSWLLALKVTGVTVVDTGIALTTGDGVTADAAKLVDTTHPNSTGQQAIANILDDVLATI